MSELQELLSRRLQLSQTAEAARTRVTVRLTYDRHQKLVRLAAAFGMSKTATCEDITDAAIQDAWNHYLSTLDPDEVQDILRAMDDEADGDSQAVHWEAVESQRLADDQAQADAFARSMEDHPGTAVLLVPANGVR